jgi:hypothetical protein
VAKTARDLDRAYVINGSDLLIALSGMNGRPPLVPHPRDVAEYILDTIAVVKPAGADRDPWALEDDDDLVVAHVCCEHARASRASRELGVADQVIALLDHQGERYVKRILRWAWDYLTDGDEPPF